MISNELIQQKQQELLKLRQFKLQRQQQLSMPSLPSPSLPSKNEPSHELSSVEFQIYDSPPVVSFTLINYSKGNCRLRETGSNGHAS